jgi:hypothetical protein
MTAKRAAKQVRQWFGDGHLPSLELPDGWFGRPYDNCHALSHLDVIGDRLLIGLDGQQLLVLTRPAVTYCTHGEMVLTFEQLVFDWQGYGDRTPHAKGYAAGQLRFATGLA